MIHHSTNVSYLKAWHNARVWKLVPAQQLKLDVRQLFHAKVFADLLISNVGFTLGGLTKD